MNKCFILNIILSAKLIIKFDIAKHLHEKVVPLKHIGESLNVLFLTHYPQDIAWFEKVQWRYGGEIFLPFLQSYKHAVVLITQL